MLAQNKYPPFFTSYEKFEESGHGYMHKTWICGLSFNEARMIFYILNQHGISVYNIAAKVRRAFQFFL